MDTRFYVYVHKLNGDVVYIGMGVGGRYEHKSTRSDRHLNEWDNLEKTKVKEGLTKDQAHRVEQELLDEYFPSGKLFNKTRNSNKVNAIKYSEVIKHFCYDENSPSGLVHSRNKFGGHNNSTKVVSVGDNAGSLSTGGYYQVIMNGKLVKSHRVVLCLTSEQDIPTDSIVDHIDNDRSNNRSSNLRLVSASDNVKNKKHKSTNTGYQAISEKITEQVFTVQYTFDFKRYTIYFSYNLNKSQRPRGRHYLSRNEAFTAALRYRNELIEQCKIVLTGK